MNSVSLTEVYSEPSYQGTILFWKYLFTTLTLTLSLLVGNRLRKQTCIEMGLVQKKVLILLGLLFLFNEPLVGIDWVTKLKFYHVVQSSFQATYFAFLLHFWAYVLDTIVANDVRAEPIKFYCPKVCLVVLIWVCITFSVMITKLKEISSAGADLNN